MAVAVAGRLVFSQLTPLLKSLTYLDFLNGIFENTAICLAEMLGVRLLNFIALKGTANGLYCPYVYA